MLSYLLVIGYYCSQCYHNCQCSVFSFLMRTLKTIPIIGYFTIIVVIVAVVELTGPVKYNISAG